MKVLNEVKERNSCKTDFPFPLQQIYFYLTAGCNLACRHCWLSPKLQNGKNVYPMLPLEVFTSILKQAKPLGLIAAKLTGGEPLMHPHIHEILRIIREWDLDLTIETNGVLCSSQLAEKIALCRNPSVSVSLDGVDAKTHEDIRGIKGCFSAAVKGIHNLVNAGIRPQIIMALMQRNKDQVKDLVRFAESLGAESVKFNIMNPSGRGEMLTEVGGALPIEELLEMGKWVWNTLSHSTKLNLVFSLPTVFRPLSDIYGGNGTCCGTCKLRTLIGVLADGSYALCGIGTQIPDLIFGHASKDRLGDVWKNNKILKELRGDIFSRFEGICGNCHMKKSCVASCIAQNYYRSGSLWKSFWFCEEAYKKGLFPPSRIIPKPFSMVPDSRL